MGDKGSVVVADCGRGVEKGGFQILLDVADFGCVLPHTVKIYPVWGETILIVGYIWKFSSQSIT